MPDEPNLSGLDRVEAEPLGTNAPARLLAQPSPVPARIGRYTIVRVLGQGGMGVVYEALQESPARVVALKVIRAGHLSDSILRRFGQESEVLGRLHHPGIAQVYEAGTVDDEHGHSMPFFAMEFISGAPLTKYAGSKKLGTRERLELIAKICDAVYHAHQKGVIHRDLKPDNILVDETGQPKILDFGVARATDSDIQSATLQTDIGQILGTVPYMSPEQVSGDPRELDTRSDVYAIGVIAYELLAERLPYDLRQKMVHEAVRIIREEDPARLSSINRTLKGDVETIVAKALEKDKVRRYQSAESMASDVRRYLRHEPIAARPASTWYQLEKFSRRNTGLVSGIAAAFVLLIVGLVATVWEARRAIEQGEVATQRTNDVLSLSAIQDLKELENRADTLWPATPNNVQKYEAWLTDARVLIEGRPANPAQRVKKRPSLLEHEAKLEEIRKRAKPDTRDPYEFQDGEDRWWHAQLSKLVQDLRAFTNAETGGLFTSGISEKHGWGIPRRAEFARTIAERSVTGAMASRRWSEAIDAISKSPKYGGLALTPQLGLLPIGADPQSGLWEFWHEQSGDEPQRGNDGQLVLSESMGIVLVLIPGGIFWMGAQRDPNEKNFDVQAEVVEAPVHEVRLSPYFLSKYEMTQGQWKRFAGQNPSQYGPGNELGSRPTTLLDPVERVSWDDAIEVLSRLALDLPTEAQWERGARGGTETPWSTGTERDTLLGAANLADQSAASVGATWQEIQDWPELNDGWAAHAPVGSFRPNDFGLHDVHGNVCEWCLDGFDGGFYGKRPTREPLALESRTHTRVNRGGGFSSSASDSRSARRTHNTPDARNYDLGLRPARALTP